MYADDCPADVPVATRALLVASGYSYSAIAHRLRRGTWVAHGRAIVLHAGPLTDEQRLWVAVFSHPQPCALAATTAAVVHGLRGWDVPDIHVVVPDNVRAHKQRGIVVHQSRRFGPHDVTLAGGLPIVSRQRAVADAASLQRTARSACGLVGSAVQQGVVTATLVKGEIQRVLRLKHRRHLLVAVADFLGGADSLAEIDFTRLAARAGLPAPIRQSPRWSEGKKRYLDVDFGVFCVEVDGGLHMREDKWSADALRLNDLWIDGERILRFTAWTVRHDEAAVVRQLRRAWNRFSDAISPSPVTP